MFGRILSLFLPSTVKTEAPVHVVLPASQVAVTITHPVADKDDHFISAAPITVCENPVISSYAAQVLTPAVSPESGRSFVRLPFLPDFVVYTTSNLRRFESPCLEVQDYIADVEDFLVDPRLMGLLSREVLATRVLQDEDRKYAMRGYVSHHEEKFSAAGQSIAMLVYDAPLAEVFDYNDLTDVLRDAHANPGRVNQVVLVQRAEDRKSIARLLVFSVRFNSVEQQFVVHCGFNSGNSQFKENTATLVMRAHGEYRRWLLQKDRKPVTPLPEPEGAGVVPQLPPTDLSQASNSENEVFFGDGEEPSS